MTASGRVAPTIALLILAGCGSWHRQPVGELVLVNPRAVVEVWRGRENLVLHGIRLTTDSLFGVRYFQPLNCDSCRLAIPRSEIDSVRLGGSMSNNPVTWFVVGITALSLFIYISICGWRGCSYT